MMTAGVVETNGLNHRTYHKSAIAPTMLLQANAASSGRKTAKRVEVQRPTGAMLTGFVISVVLFAYLHVSLVFLMPFGVLMETNGL